MLVCNLFMSVDPYMRGRMNEGQSFGHTVLAAAHESNTRWSFAQAQEGSASLCAVMWSFISSRPRSIAVTLG